MDKQLKDAKELHSEHQKWLSDIAFVKSELFTFAKHNKGSFKKDISSLLHRASRAKDAINKHEKTIALAITAGVIYDKDKVFADHNTIREEIESLKFQIANFRIIFSRYNKDELGLI